MASNAPEDNSPTPLNEEAKMNGPTDHSPFQVPFNYKSNPFTEPANDTQAPLPSPPSSTTTEPNHNTLTTHIHTHLSHATHTKLTSQLRTHVLARCARRVLAFWQRHLPSSPALQRMAGADDDEDDEDDNEKENGKGKGKEKKLVEKAQEWVARNAVDELGALRSVVEASYRAGPRGKFEIFEERRVVGVSEYWREDGEGDGEGEWEEGEKVVRRVLGDQDWTAGAGDEVLKGAFGAWVALMKGVCEVQLTQAAEKQSVKWCAGDELRKLEEVEEARTILREFGVSVQVEARKRLRRKGIFGIIDGENEAMAEAVERVRKECSREKVREGMGKRRGKKEQMRGRKRRSSDGIRSVLENMMLS